MSADPVGGREAETYPWLTINEDGSMESDMLDTTPAEADRRLIIMQELRAGRVVLRSASSAAQNPEERRILSAVRAAMDGPRPIPGTVKNGIVRMIDSASPCRHCDGRGRYAHENIETGTRNAVDCPRCKGTGVDAARSPQDKDHEENPDG